LFERLEFFGDKVLQYLVTLLAYHELPRGQQQHYNTAATTLQHCCSTTTSLL
jgi:dsRNA-specific ribonuclease